MSGIELRLPKNVKALSTRERRWLEGAALRMGLLVGSAGADQPHFSLGELNIILSWLEHPYLSQFFLNLTRLVHAHRDPQTNQYDRHTRANAVWLELNARSGEDHSKNPRTYSALVWSVMTRYRHLLEADYESQQQELREDKTWNRAVRVLKSLKEGQSLHSVLLSIKSAYEKATGSPLKNRNLENLLKRFREDDELWKGDAISFIEKLYLAGSRVGVFNKPNWLRHAAMTALNEAVCALPSHRNKSQMTGEECFGILTEQPRQTVAEDSAYTVVVVPQPVEIDIPERPQEDEAEVQKNNEFAGSLHKIHDLYRLLCTERQDVKKTFGANRNIRRLEGLLRERTKGARWRHRAEAFLEEFCAQPAIESSVLGGRQFKRFRFAALDVMSKFDSSRYITPGVLENVAADTTQAVDVVEMNKAVNLYRQLKDNPIAQEALRRAILDAKASPVLQNNELFRKLKVLLSADSVDYLLVAKLAAKLSVHSGHRDEIGGMLTVGLSANPLPTAPELPVVAAKSCPFFEGECVTKIPAPSAPEFDKDGAAPAA